MALHNWRLLETEIVDIARREGFELDRDEFGDVVVVNCQDYDMNLTYLAQELSKRGVLARGNAVSART